jgi:hypothetical protein
MTRKIPGYRIRFSKSFFVKNHIESWGAVHIHEAHAYHLKFPYPKKTVVLQMGMTKSQREEATEVARRELRLMDRKKMSYKRAHRIASRSVR